MLSAQVVTEGVHVSPIGRRTSWAVSVAFATLSVMSAACANGGGTPRVETASTDEYCDIARDLRAALVDEVSLPLAEDEQAIQPVLERFVDVRAAQIEAIRLAAPKEVASSVDAVWRNFEALARTGDTSVLETPAAQDASDEVLNFDSEVCGLSRMGFG